jgi:hypothetical protein
MKVEVGLFIVWRDVNSWVWRTNWRIICRGDFIGRDNGAISMATDSLKNKQSYEICG